MTREKITKKDIKEAFPLHYFVWEKDEDGLREYLDKNPKVSVVCLLFKVSLLQCVFFSGWQGKGQSRPNCPYDGCCFGSRKGGSHIGDGKS